MSEVNTAGKIILLYNKTNHMAKPWLDAGYQVFMFDGQHDGIKTDGNLTTIGMWFDAYKTSDHVKEIAEICGAGVDLVIGFPECTDMSVAGAKHFKKKELENPAFQAESVELAKLVMYVGDYYECPWMLENPVSVLSTMWRSPGFYFDPCDYAGYLPANDNHPDYPEVYPPRDRYNKKTGIWLGNGFISPEFKRIEPFEKDNPGWKRCGGKSLKTKNIRSATPRGFAQAVFESNHKKAAY